MVFGLNGDLYVSAGGNPTETAISQIFDFGTEPEAVFTVTNTTASTLPLTLNYATTDGTDIWLLDPPAAKVYKYTGAASLLSGSQTASATFALAPGDTNPQGITDPPPTGTLLAPVEAPLTLNEPSVAGLDAASSVWQPAVTSIPSPAGSDVVFGLLAGASLPTPLGNAPKLTSGEILPSWLAGMTPLIPVSNGWLGSNRGTVDPTAGTLAGEEGAALKATTDTDFARLTEDAATAE